MNNQELHIAQVGEYFFSIDDFDFLSGQNLLEFDFIVLNAESLCESLEQKSFKKVEKKINELKEFIKVKNIPVVIFLSQYSTVNVLSGESFEEITIWELLGIDCVEEFAEGRKIEIKNDTLFAEILKEQIDNFEYTVCFSKHPGTNIGNAKSKNISVGFYTQDFVILPEIIEGHTIDEEDFLHKLYALCKSVRTQDVSYQIPQWANDFFLPGEKEEIENLKKTISSINKLEKEKLKQEKQLLNYLPLKQLWTASGFNLEKVVKDVFIELGFTILESQAYRDDIIMKWDNQIIIAEIKGVGKSAAEKNAAQLEKWVSTYISENEVVPKALLIVNTFREVPIDKRTQDSFPPQMLPYSNNRNHCLLTSLQLCNLLLFIRKNPTKKESEIKKLLMTIGQFQGFDNWQEYISINAKSKKTKKV